ncbi:hypothetical protein HYPSUDRAFT_200968 [Hypholoma sublateritium FD-334 SS-4]|uniref:Uncharacterized protein n=1 Tax=Hypholoma sublateritium (strain FD-334 SS-4) TaxID=945553 RepID=A0A0D2MJH1_HYPSF|nr:hypothetical protein HYPSUDRAFT_200968 [Hypholoma sublateritium FD-334 SS-4]
MRLITDLGEGALHAVDDVFASLIRETVEEEHAVLLAKFQSNLWYLAPGAPRRLFPVRPSRRMSCLPSKRRASVDAVIEAISEPSALRDAALSKALAVEYNLTVSKLFSVLSPMIHSLHEPVDYDFIARAHVVSHIS